MKFLAHFQKGRMMKAISAILLRSAVALRACVTDADGTFVGGDLAALNDQVAIRQ
jgi:hypothetical protein